ncbi:hypothetical protein M378DRAFT_13480 [Amanita muscaria Koide BX008]|uniref:Uncharacterized protein n=1 Tax=Amanita muscaria (strain Koide BX008) TaxID=946122 RepID=A0A0C2WYD8_AMAMK|nr:hypothetical protein M378DRAFT_13480 [Amanita muscaria Koide BX008]
MKLAVGPLTTGTYVSHAVVHQGKYYGLHKDVDGTKLSLIEDKEHEGIKWYIEKVGENRFKARNASSSNRTVSINPVDKQTVEVTEGESEWIIEPTDVDGEYIGSPAHDTSVFATATPGEATVKVGPKSEMTRFNIYRVDND